MPPRVFSSASRIERWTSTGASCRRPMTRTRTPCSTSSSVYWRTAPSIRPNRPVTSSSGRRQFSWLKTYSERTSISRSGAIRTMGTIASTPWTWPAMAGQPAGCRPAAVAVHDDGDVSRALAQGAPQTSITSASLRSARRIHRLDVAIGQALQVVKLAVLLVLGQVAVTQGPLEVVRRLAAVVADLDARLLGAACAPASPSPCGAPR